MILVLSPHLDDAVMSIGALLHGFSQRGKHILIRTIMAGDPPTPLPQTPLIKDLHQRWNAGGNPMAARRVEDQKAAALIGAEVEHLPWADCPYRTNAKGEALYPQNNDLFGPVHPDDPLWLLSLDIPSHTRQIIAPLGAGNHVDHQLIRHLALKLETDLPLWCYTEYPYGGEKNEGRKISANPQLQPTGKAAIQQALATFPKPPLPLRMMTEDRNWGAKLAAMACYESQISTFWDSIEDMQIKARAYTEQLWIRRK